MFLVDAPHDGNRPCSSPRLLPYAATNTDTKRKKHRETGVVGVPRSHYVWRRQLKRVHAESRMSIDAYRTVFEKSIDFGGRKLTQALQTKGQLAEMIEGLEGEIAGLKKEVAHLEDTCEGLAHRESLKEATYEEQPKEILDLEAEKQQLTDLIATLKPSKPEKGK